jgi:hypothetical protein
MYLILMHVIGMETHAQMVLQYYLRFRIFYNCKLFCREYFILMEVLLLTCTKLKQLRPKQCFCLICVRIRVGFHPLLTQNKQCHFLITTIWIRTFFKLFENVTLYFVTIWLYWYCSSEIFVDQGEWSIYLFPNKIMPNWSSVIDKWHFYYQAQF